MKLNRKIIIPAATLLIGVALAGSATSTIAWYQYSTKANVAYLGTSIGTTGNLRVRIVKQNNVDADWKSFISYDDVDTFLGSKKIAPVTPGKLGKDEALPTPEDNKPFYANPVAGYGPLEQWIKAESTSYVQIPLQFKFVETDGTKDGNGNYYIEKQVAKDLYLSDLLIQNDYQNSNNSKRDLSSAVRVHFEAYQAGSNAKVNHLVSKDGGETATVGNLDLDNIPGDDKTYTAADDGAQYGFGESPNQKGTLINYGAKEGVATEDNKQVSYKPSEIVNVKKLGQTSDTDGVYLNVNVTIWLEGWQKLGKASDTDETKSSIWDYAKTVDSLFDVGMEFEAKTPNA